MPHFGVPNQGRRQRIRDIAQVNWRRGLFRVWLLLSAAWTMGWVVYLIIHGIKDGPQSSGELLAIPVLLVGPPIALLLFGIVAGWAVRGFMSELRSGTICCTESALPCSNRASFWTPLIIRPGIRAHGSRAPAHSCC